MLSPTQLDPHVEDHHIVLSANLSATVLIMKCFHRNEGRKKPRKEGDVTILWFSVGKRAMTWIWATPLKRMTYIYDTRRKTALPRTSKPFKKEVFVFFKWIQTYLTAESLCFNKVWFLNRVLHFQDFHHWKTNFYGH